jgi:Protein of unknown function (DUF2934)
MDDREQRVREIAYFLWIEDGRPDGEADRHWRTAEEGLDLDDAGAREPAAEAAETLPSASEPREARPPVGADKRRASAGRA